MNPAFGFQLARLKTLRADGHGGEENAATFDEDGVFCVEQPGACGPGIRPATGFADVPELNGEPHGRETEQGSRRRLAFPSRGSGSCKGGAPCSRVPNALSFFDSLIAPEWKTWYVTYRSDTHVAGRASILKDKPGGGFRGTHESRCSL